jgi:pimeloyl-ACP methyl ester carboxylesterase
MQMQNRVQINFRVVVKFSIMFVLLFAALIGVTFLLQPGRGFHDVVIEGPGYSLSGTMSKGTDPFRGWVIFVHGNRRAGVAHPLYQAILQKLDKSVSVLGIDMRGYGKSSVQGLDDADRILDREEDISAAANWLMNEFGIVENDIVLVGHSLGALQVLNAAGNRDYRGVVSIGPGAFEQFVKNPHERFSYIAKFERNTGVRMDEDILVNNARLLMLPDILTPCPTGHVTIIHGAREEGMLNSRKGDVPGGCINKVSWKTIPLSDHMYGSESQLWGPIRLPYALLSQSLLMWNLNGAI